MSIRRLAARRSRGLVGRGHGTLDEEEVEWSGRALRASLGELHDVEPLGDGDELVLEVEEGELAAVARGELDDPDPQAGRRGARSGPKGRQHGHQMPSRPNTSVSCASENTGPSLQTK
jgi:hypothetical protein